MARKPYLPHTDVEKLVWLTNFSQKAALYQTELGLSNETVVQLDTDLDAFSDVMESLVLLRNTLEGFTAFKNQLRDGSGTLVVPPLPTLPTFPPDMESDIFGRVRKLVQVIKGNPNYTESIGDDMRIIGEETPDDPNTWKPDLKVQLQGGKPNIKWKKGNSSGIKLWVDRGAGLEFLAIDTQPDYLDNHPLPPLGQSAIWKYRAIYVLDDAEVGQFSDILEVTVKGAL